METFLDFFHMGSVEWVTAQVPLSQSRGGGLEASRSEALACLIGARRLRVDGVLVDAGTVTSVAGAAVVAGVAVSATGGEGSAIVSICLGNDGQL